MLEVKDQPNEPVQGDTNAGIELPLADSSLRADSVLEAKELLGRLWPIVRELPASQRDAFCLTFEDESGADLFSLLLEAGIVTLPQLAQALDRSLERVLQQVAFHVFSSG
ncbi:MAG: hypothetical protein ACREA9_21255 [Pyrinomonadaceae bacterium]